MQNTRNERLTRQDFFKGLATLLALQAAAVLSFGASAPTQRQGLDASAQLWKWYFPEFCTILVFFVPIISEKYDKRASRFAPDLFVPASIIVALLDALYATGYKAALRPPHNQPPAYMQNLHKTHPASAALPAAQ